MSKKYTSGELFGTRKNLEEKKKQEVEDQLVAAKLVVEMSKAKEDVAEHTGKDSLSRGEDMGDEELDDTDTGSDRIGRWDADVAAAKAIIRRAASTPESARAMRKYLARQMEISPTRKSGQTGKVIKRTRDRGGKKIVKQIAILEASPAFAEEVDDLELTKEGSWWLEGIQPQGA
ncbi:hypothetical protein QM012_003378 [Aureobasidium pullulans]|uniref:Uncharacterized protein n=1 Tax=Aureobasidium pullulans TaxID=5580 RepID=A0ABR0T895_AURPU